MNTFQTAIAEHPFFKTMRPDHLALISKNAQAVKFKPEDILFREGESANRLFLIQSGRVDLEWRAESGCGVAAKNVGPGEVLGWSWLFPPFLWHFTAEALEPTHAIVLDGKHLLAACDKNPEFGYALMKRIAQILIHQMESARNVL
jgi:CRP/FNR family cyclic AMP-dependent transcriptional regulator